MYSIRHDRPVDGGPPPAHLAPETRCRPKPDAGDFTQTAVSAWNPISSVVKEPVAVLSPVGVSWLKHMLAHFTNLLKEGLSLSSAS
jgi:hypothetical protein